MAPTYRQVRFKAGVSELLEQGRLSYSHVPTAWRVRGLDGGETAKDDSDIAVYGKDLSPFHVGRFEFSPRHLGCAGYNPQTAEFHARHLPPPAAPGRARRRSRDLTAAPWGSSAQRRRSRGSGCRQGVADFAGEAEQRLVAAASADQRDAEGQTRRPRRAAGSAPARRQARRCRSGSTCRAGWGGSVERRSPRFGATEGIVGRQITAPPARWPSTISTMPRSGVAARGATAPRRRWRR